MHIPKTQITTELMCWENSREKNQEREREKKKPNPSINHLFTVRNTLDREYWQDIFLSNRFVVVVFALSTGLGTIFIQT